VLRHALPLVLIVIIAACGKEPAPVPLMTTTTAPPPVSPFEVGAMVSMTGLDAATGRVEVPDINVWTTPQRVSTACRVKHSASASISAREYRPSEDRWYFSITSGSCSGWVPQSFLEPRS
jgi:hypothetical protein